jgi:hypothetical protein
MPAAGRARAGVGATAGRGRMLLRGSLGIHAERCSREPWPGSVFGAVWADAGAVAIRAPLAFRQHRERRHPGWQVTATLLRGKAMASAPRGREQCSGSGPAERCMRTDAFGVPASSCRHSTAGRASNPSRSEPSGWPAWSPAWPIAPRSRPGSSTLGGRPDHTSEMTPISAHFVSGALAP